MPRVDGRWFGVDGCAHRAALLSTKDGRRGKFLYEPKHIGWMVSFRGFLHWACRHCSDFPQTGQLAYEQNQRALALNDLHSTSSETVDQRTGNSVSQQQIDERIVASTIFIPSPDGRFITVAQSRPKGDGFECK